MRAHLIGESTGGMTAVEIYSDNGDLIWSHEWFRDGCSTAGYIAGLVDAYQCMHQAANVEDFESGQTDDDGEPEQIDAGETTGVMLVHDTVTGWSIGEFCRLGQSSEIVDACMTAGLISADGDHDEQSDNATVKAITNHISKILIGKFAGFVEVGGNLHA